MIITLADDETQDAEQVIAALLVCLIGGVFFLSRHHFLIRSRRRDKAVMRVLWMRGGTVFSQFTEIVDGALLDHLFLQV